MSLNFNFTAFDKKIIEMEARDLAKSIIEKAPHFNFNEVYQRLIWMRYEEGVSLYPLSNRSYPPTVICDECGYFIFKKDNINKSKKDLPVICHKCARMFHRAQQEMYFKSNNIMESGLAGFESYFLKWKQLPGKRKGYRPEFWVDPLRFVAWRDAEENYLEQEKLRKLRRAKN